MKPEIVSQTAGNIEPRAILVPKALATGEIHNFLELYIANQRLAGHYLTKPYAVVELVRIGYQHALTDTQPAV